MPQIPPIPITDITNNMFGELPTTNSGTILSPFSDKPYKAYKPDPGHQVGMTLEDEHNDHQVEMVEPGHQVEMTYPAPSHQVEMTYPSYMSWYKPSEPDEPNDHPVGMVEAEPKDHQVEMVPPKRPATSRQEETTQEKPPVTSPAQTTSGEGWIPFHPTNM